MRSGLKRSDEQDVHRILAVAVALAVALPAVAQSTSPAPKVVKFGKPKGTSTTDYYAVTASNVAMDDVASNAAAASRTFVLDVAPKGVSTATVWIDVTEAGTITAVVLTCSGSPNAGTTYGQKTSTSVAAGVGTVVVYADSYALTASGVLMLEYDVRKFDKFKCLVDITGGGATDTFDVHATGAVGY